MATKPKGGKGPTPPKKSTASAERSPTHPDDEVPTEKAQTKTASGSPPKQQNTTGQINKKTAAAPKGAPTNPKPDISKTHEYLDSVKPAEIRAESTKVLDQLKTATEAGDRVRATQAKDVLAGLKDKAHQAGLGPKDVPELANYSAGQFLEIAGALMGGGRGRRKAPAVKTASGGGGKGGYVPRRAKKRVKCFCVQDHAKGGRDEYQRQLDHQQQGINSMTAKEYLAERRAYTGKDPCNGYQKTADGVTKKRNPKVTKNARAKRLRTLEDKHFKEMQERMPARDAERLSSAKAEHELGRQAPLHNQDMVAGGKDMIGTMQADGSVSLGDGDFGLSDTNSHIGSQWNGERIQSIDREACEMNAKGQGDEKMNTELRPCGKHEAKSAGCKQKRKVK